MNAWSVWIYGRLQNAKRKRRLVNAILLALRMIASRRKKSVKENARFARPNMNHFKMLSSLITSKNEMGIDVTSAAIPVPDCSCK